MSIMEKLFGSAKMEPPPAPPPGVTNNLQNNPAPAVQTQVTPQTAPNGVIPAQSDTPAAVETPLAKFDTLWQPNKDDAQEEPFGLNLDPSKLLEAASKADFSKFIPAEDLAKIEAGGPAAAGALSNILGKVAQAVYGHSSVATSKIVEAAVEQARRKFEKAIPSLIKQEQVHASLLKENPAFNSPAVLPVIESLRAQMASKYPKASSEELTEMAKQYLVGVAQTISPPAKPAKAEVPKSEDWSDFLS